MATTAVPPRAPSTPQPVASWKVVSVHDGDTLRAIDKTNHEIKVRLHGIDAPEIGQAFGTVSRDALAKMVKGKAVQLEVMDTDRYGRTVARVIVGGIDANVRMVADGMAWHYRKYSDDPKLAAAERAARAAKRGLWADAKPVAPWEWWATEKGRK